MQKERSAQSHSPDASHSTPPAGACAPLHRRLSPPPAQVCEEVSNWVRMTLLHKFGGAWLDASIFCTAPVEAWARQPEKLCVFSQRTNTNILENWAIVAPRGHWLVAAWRKEMGCVHAETPFGAQPLGYIEKVFATNAVVNEQWDSFGLLPYLWCHLTLLVVLSRHPKALECVDVLSGAEGPMYRRHLTSELGKVPPGPLFSERFATHLATHPLAPDAHDRHFIKFVSSDRAAVQARLDAGDYAPGSALSDILRVGERALGEQSRYPQ